MTEQDTSRVPATPFSPARVPSIETLSSRRRWLVVAVLSLSLIVIVMDATILDIAIPDLSQDLQPSTNQLLWIVDSYSLVLAGMIVPLSAVGDRWGRKRMLLAGYLLFGAASILALVAHSAELVIAIRSVLGVGAAMIMPTTLAMLRVVFTDGKERAIALGVWAAVAGVGSALGPLAGGLLLEYFSWRSAFLMNVPLTVLGLVAGYFVLPESRSATPGRWDIIAAGESLFGMVALVWAVKQFAKVQKLAIPEGWAVLTVGVVLLIAFVCRCLRAPDPFLDLRLFARRQFTVGVIAALGSMVALSAAFLLVIQWMELVKGLSPVVTGVELIPSALASAVTSLIAPWLAGKWSVRVVLGGSIGVSAAGMALFGLWPGELSLWAAAVALVLLGGGYGALTLGSALIMSATPAGRAGNAAAIEEVSYDLGSVLGVAVLGSIAGIIYRSGLDEARALDRLSAELADASRSSLGNAVAAAERVGDPMLARAASDEFVRSLEVTGLIGGIFLFGVATLVFFLIRRGVDLAH